MAILVTGGAGFIGSHLIERLLAETDEQIFALDDFNDYYDPAIKRANAELYRDSYRVLSSDFGTNDSFCDPANMKELFSENPISHVVHLGAHAGVRPSVARPLDFQQVNVCGTLQLLEMARQFPVKRFVFASSSTVYGSGATSPFQEDAPLGVPMCPYGVSKRCAELYALNYCQLHNVPVVVLRLFSVYGPRLRPDLAMSIFAKAILSGESFPLFGDGSIRRDFTHVSDICDGIMAALFRDNVVGETINLGNSEPIAMRDVIGKLETAFGKWATIDTQPACREEMPITCADVTKARRLLGYDPKVSFDDGVVEFADWYREAHVEQPA